MLPVILPRRALDKMGEKGLAGPLKYTDRYGRGISINGSLLFEHRMQWPKWAASYMGSEFIHQANAQKIDGAAASRVFLPRFRGFVLGANSNGVVNIVFPAKAP